jgi:hypothetical protein
MDSAGHVALTDLGISAKVEARPPVCTQTSGTLGYMVRLYEVLVHAADLP